MLNFTKKNQIKLATVVVVTSDRQTDDQRADRRERLCPVQIRHSNGTLQANEFVLGDSLTGHLGQKFSTRDADNDVWPNSCAVTFKGAWWYARCHRSKLNGRYLRGNHTSYADGVNWSAWKGQYYSLRFTEMKIKPFYRWITWHCTQIRIKPNTKGTFDFSYTLLGKL